MMKKIAIALTLASLAALSAPQGGKPKPAPPKTSVKCPIMRSNPVKISEATKTKMFADYKGRRYFFCCAGCPDAFKKNPEKWSKGAESIPIPKAKKK